MNFPYILKITVLSKTIVSLEDLNRFFHLFLISIQQSQLEMKTFLSIISGNTF